MQKARCAKAAGLVVNVQVDTPLRSFRVSLIQYFPDLSSEIIWIKRFLDQRGVSLRQQLVFYQYFFGIS